LVPVGPATLAVGVLAPAFGPAIRDLAIALAVDERYRGDLDSTAFDSVSTIEVGG
jgi:hypothetical protein